MQEKEISSSIAEEAKDVFLKKLRTATGPMHEKLEANPTSTAILKPEVTLEQYAKYLSIMKDIIAFDEQALFPLVKDFTKDVDQRHKLQLIQDDLEYLQAQGAAYTTTNNYAPFKSDISIPFALGYMYVMEGSTLGGRVILKHINTTLGFDENNGAKFFVGYGTNTGKLWKTFLDDFVKYTIQHQQEEEVINGAKHAFKSIDDYYALNA